MHVVVVAIWGSVLLLSSPAGQDQCVRDEVSNITQVINTLNAAHDPIPVVDTSNRALANEDLFLSKTTRGDNHSLQGPSRDFLLRGRARLLEQTPTFLSKTSFSTFSQPGALEATIDTIVEVVTVYLGHCVLEMSTAADPAVEGLVTKMRQALVPGLVLRPSSTLINTTDQDSITTGLVSACAVHLLLLVPENGWPGGSRNSGRSGGVEDVVQEVLQVLRQTHVSAPRHYVFILAPYATSVVHTKSLLLEPHLSRSAQVFLLLPESLHSGVRVKVDVYQRCQYCVGGGVGVVLSARWVQGGTSHLHHLFDDRLRDFHGHVFHTVTMDFPPFIDYDRTHVAPGGVMRPKDSMDIRILQEAARLLNFSFELREPADGVWGYLLENGTWTGTVGTVQREEADFSMMLSVTWERSYAVSFTRAYCIEPMTFLMKKPGSLPQWQAPIKPFHWVVWTVMVTSVVLSGPALWLLLRLSASPHPCERREQEEGGGRTGVTLWRRADIWRLSFGSLSLYMLAPVLSASAPLFPTSVSSRAWCGVWWFFCILTTTLYRGILISHLTVPSLSPTLDTLELLASSNLQWGMLNTYDSGYQLFRSSEVPVYKALFRKMEYHDMQESMARVLEGNYAFISWKTYFRNLIARDYSDRNGATKVYIAREEFFPGGFGWAFAKNSPYLPAFDQVFQRLIESGLIDKWMTDLIQLSAAENREKPKLLEPEVKGPQPFAVYHLQGIFFIMLGGSMVALLVFLGETLLGRFMVLP